MWLLTLDRVYVFYICEDLVIHLTKFVEYP